MYNKDKNKYQGDVEGDILNCGCVVGFLIILTLILWRILG